MLHCDSSGNVEVAVAVPDKSTEKSFISQPTPPCPFPDTADEKKMLHRMQQCKTSRKVLVESCETSSRVGITRTGDNIRPLTHCNPDGMPLHTPHAYPLHEINDPLPPPPTKWPQAPLMLRPTPNSSTRVRGVRYASSDEYLDLDGFRDGCILPINTGAEEPGKSFVIDFESTYFIGTLLMRIQQAPAAEPSSQLPTSYFDGKKRRFQSVIKGRFKQELSMSQCVTGQMFDRATGKLPTKWIVSSAIRLVSALSPQLEATIDGTQPKFLAPLAATAHSILQYPIVEENTSSQVFNATRPLDDMAHRLHGSYYRGAKDLECPVEEPHANSDHSILPDVLRASNLQSKHSTISSSTTSFVPLSFASSTSSSSSVMSRQRIRKACLNKVTATRDMGPKFSTQKEYCFEFYQHLLLFGNDLAIDLGRIGQISLTQPLNGQPLKCMAAVTTKSSTPSSSSTLIEPLWSFDIWHANLYPLAQESY
jgi:Protein of unknown function (DUF1769)